MGGNVDEHKSISKELGSYIMTRLQLFKYQAVAKGAPIAADIVAGITVIFCYLLTFVFASLTLGLFLADFLGSGWAGFGALALVYILIAGFVIIFKKRVEHPVQSIFISKILK